MKGRSPWNKTDVRKRDAYGLLLKLGGEARWKDLKANLEELGWGPTTLKKTLDKLVEEKSIIKEARLGREGAEVWYKVQIKDSDIWAPLDKALAEGKTVSMKEITLGIQKKLPQLREQEKEVFLKEQIRKIVDMARDTCTALFYMAARGAKKTGTQTGLSVFEYTFDLVFKKQITEYVELCIEYPEYTMVITDSLMTGLSEKESEKRLRFYQEF